MMQKDILTKEFLIEHYVNQRKSAQTIANETGINHDTTVFRALSKHGICRSSLKNSTYIFTKDFLEEHYLRQNLSLKDVAELGGFKSTRVVLRALETHKIPIRENTHSNKKQEYYQRRRFHHTIPGSYFSRLSFGAKNRGIDFDITMDEAWSLFVKQKRKCKLSGLPLRFHLHGERMSEQTASLDRIDSALGYSVRNCQWLHKDINKMKLDHDQDLFIRYCKLVAKNSVLK